MFEGITIFRNSKTKEVSVVEQRQEGQGMTNVNIINQGTRPQDHVFADNVERTLRNNGVVLTELQQSETSIVTS